MLRHYVLPVGRRYISEERRTPPAGSLPFSEASAIGSSLEPNKSSPHPLLHHVTANHA
jgi:hypothetical protein